MPWCQIARGFEFGDSLCPTTLCQEGVTQREMPGRADIDQLEGGLEAPHGLVRLAACQGNLAAAELGQAIIWQMGHGPVERR